METTSVTSSFVSSTGFYSLIILTIVLTAIYFYMESSRTVRYGRKLPGPRTVPFFGNLLLALNIHPRDILSKILAYDIYGPVARAFVGKELVVFLTDPRDVEIVLSSHVHITKSPEYRFFKPWLGDGLLISNGQKWYSHRKFIAPSFHMSILKSFVPLFYENSLTLVKRLKNQIGKEFDCHDYLSTITVDILVETAMGVRGKNKEKMSFDYAKAVMKMCNIIHIRQYSIFLRFDKYFKWTKYGMEQEKLVNTAHSLTSRIIKEKKLETLNSNVVESTNKSENVKNTNDKPEKKYTNLHYVKDDLDEIDENDIGLKKRSAFLEHMLELAKNGTNLTDEEIKEEVDTIMFEGHDTTAAASSFILCILGVNPDIQERVMEELNTIFNGSDRPCTFQDTLEMKYFERVILETLRLFPPVPAIARTLNEDIQLVSNKKILPAKCRVIIPQYKIHRLPEYYPNPEEFNPDNFLPEKMQQRHYYSYIPFSAGPRSCVGRKFALLKLKVLISTILRNYKIMADIPYTQFKLQVDIILKRSDGFNIRIEPRQNISSEIPA
ncbi:PREDICTED: cytochrome P450 4g15-like [Polistes dominula]|uniref:Cytochrome P450 4g15-like n=1 Tax=Polistes dominula TaxID=743375 RepID=A0ABM1ITQ1_POLDO|nr:PREDICTED: cytochrome P450 4g15-like [Polistes dominula]